MCCEIILNNGMLGFIPDCCKNEKIRNKAVIILIH